MVWRKASLYRADVGPVSAWVYVIARNLRIDKLRRSVPWLEVGPQAAAAVASRDVPADEQVLQQQHCQLVTSAVAKLTSKQRTVVTLGFSEGMSHREISDKLSLPLGTVKSRTRLGHAKLRSALDALR